MLREKFYDLVDFLTLHIEKQATNYRPVISAEERLLKKVSYRLHTSSDTKAVSRRSTRVLTGSYESIRRVRSQIACRHFISLH